MAAEAQSYAHRPLPPGHDEEELREQLMFDPRPREEMNRMVMEAMTETTPRYWMVVGILAGWWSPSVCLVCGAT